MFGKYLKTIREASFRCGTSEQEGLKPDLMQALKEKATIIDLTVVSDSDEEGMMAAHRNSEKISQKTS